ncbi:MAG: sialate O-acetylesterase [Melioribacteraceae bacterium]
MKKLLYLLLVFSCTTDLFADAKLANVFTSNMVLQRDKTVYLWGKADAGEKIKINFNSHLVNVEADQSGKWKAELPPMNAGGPFELVVEGKNKIVLKNILIGEVWIASGQSNMEFQLKKCSGGEAEISKADFPSIRMFVVKHKVADTPQEDVDGEWQVCSPKTIANFSGAAYFFGKKLFSELNIPIGIIQSTWGGTPAEAWMPKNTLESDEDFKPVLARWEKKMQNYPSDLEEFKRNGEKLVAAWKIDSANAIAKGMAPPRKPNKPEGPGTRNQPCGLYNGMIYPLAPFSFRGVIWYQGEANVSRAYQYRKLFPALINDWRELWRAGDFPFYYVQLPNFQREPEPSKSGWTELREAQLLTLAVPNTGMAVTIDIGDATNLHPTNKTDVGLRLALIALDNVYDRDEFIFSGPIYKSHKIENDKFIISFTHTANGLITKDGKPLRGFKICGEDKKFVEAKAEIVGTQIKVWSDEINNPVSVRYAWADNPDCNLYNSGMLPASPFRTDDWEETTFNAR